MKKLNLVIDIGNTHIVIGVYEKQELIHFWRLHSNTEKTEDEYFTSLYTLFQQVNISLHDIKKIAIGSVVPGLTRVFEHLSQKYLSAKLHLVNAYSDIGLTFPAADPGFIGADLVINAFACLEKYDSHAIICDFGAATTVQLIGKNGYFYGTVIIPGVMTSVNNLYNKASLLSTVKLFSPKSILGTNTGDALRAGVVMGSAFMIDEIVRQIKKEYHSLDNIKVIATGGISKLISENSKEITIIDKNLTIDGLNLYCLRD